MKQPKQIEYLVVTDMRGGLINAFQRCSTLDKAKKERKEWLSYSVNGWKYPIFKRTVTTTKVKL
jgi:hypothetical protein